ncbi:MAG: MFS transporter, partial [Clostridia bacterium]|nr:MFS transporter [Clostridia bacterium]
ILVGGVINVVLGRMSDRMEKSKLLYFAIAIFSLGLVAMYTANGMPHILNLLFFGLAGFAMITGYIFVAQLTGAIMRDFTPADDTGKLQGVRMIFAVLIPMTVGPMIGNAINKAAGNMLENAGADAMTTQYIPAPGIFIAAAGVAALSLIFTAILSRVMKNRSMLHEG